MTGNEAFVAGVKQHFPALYRAAVQKVQRKSAFGGLGDNLLSDISFDPGSISVSDWSVSDSGTPASGGMTSGNSWSSVIDSISSAITQIAPAVVKTKVALDTINTNAKLAQANRPLIPYGGLLTGAGGFNFNVLLWGGAAVAAVLLLRGRSHGRR